MVQFVQKLGGVFVKSKTQNTEEEIDRLGGGDENSRTNAENTGCNKFPTNVGE